VACGLDRLCRGDCSVQTPTNEVTSALLDCQGALTECIDLSCMSEPLPTLDGATGTWTFKFVNFASTSVPLEGVRIRVCAMDDLQCASPLDETTTDATGEVTFDAPNGPGGMDAYLEATGAAIAPTLFVPRFGTIPSPLYVSWTGLDSPTLGALQGILGATENPDRGLVAVNIYSCGFRAPAGLHFASSGADGTTTQMYAVNAIPSPAATMSDGNGTAGHFANHPVGRHVLSATVAETGEHYGSIDIVVRGGFFTITSMPPSAP
jgi:hypothetical protein